MYLHFNFIFKQHLMIVHTKFTQSPIATFSIGITLTAIQINLVCTQKKKKKKKKM